LIESIVLTPQTGAAQLWQILSALAPVRAADVSLADVLRSAREPISARSTLIVITPDLHQGRTEAAILEANERDRRRTNGEAGWVPELLHLKARGTESSVILVAPGQSHEGRSPVLEEAVGIQHVLTQADIPAEIIVAGMPLRSVATFRRRRMVVRTTPTGGTVTYEMEEEVA
jgi:hypothetical protein